LRVRMLTMKDQQNQRTGLGALAHTQSLTMGKCVSLLPLLFTLIAPFATVAYEHDRPVIGILTQRSSEYHAGITTSYVKWLESFGARAIPIPYHADNETVKDIFYQINGALFPGGAFPKTDATRKIWDLAKEANEKGDKFPLWGICLGFQFMLELSSDMGKHIIHSGFDAENISMPLIFIDADEHDSRLFADAKIRDIVEHKAVTMNDHKYGIDPNVFRADKGLSSMFKITSINQDRNGRPFVSSVEAMDSDLYPYFGTQWHVEKNCHSMASRTGTDIPYEHINHSQDACSVGLAMAKLFVSQARQNRHVYADFEKYPLIWTYKIRQGGEKHRNEEYFVIPHENYFIAAVKKISTYIYSIYSILG